MDAGEGYEAIMRALQSPARERYARLLELHRETLARYVVFSGQFFQSFQSLLRMILHLRGRD